MTDISRDILLGGLAAICTLCGIAFLWSYNSKLHDVLYMQAETSDNYVISKKDCEIEVNGTVTDIDNDVLILNDKVQCRLDVESDVSVGSDVIVHGILDEHGDMLVLTSCELVEE